jgi:putative transposase
MPRVSRIVLPGLPHHITQRGNNRQDVFFVADDYRAYLALLREQKERFGLEVVGYCLMSNHVDLVAVPSSATSLAKAIGRTHFRYTQYVNRLHGRSGHLWQNRFYSCALDEGHTEAALRYVERNPVRAGMVQKAWRYEWSSAAAHVTGRDRSGLLDLDAWHERWDAGAWREVLQEPEDEAALGRLRESTARGWPLGSDSFLSKLERVLGRRVRPLPVGRPRKREVARRNG